MRKTIVILLLLITAAWAGPATQPGQPDTGGVEQAPKTELRVYDIRDFLENISDYPLRPSPPAPPPTSRPAPPTDSSNVGPMPFGFVDLSQPGTAQEKVDDFVKLIESTVDPDTWRDEGGVSGSIWELDGKMYVTQAADAQARIQKIVASATEGTHRTVRIRATWLLLTDDELAALRDPVDGPGQAITRLSDPALQKTTPLVRAELLCLDGQTVHIAAGERRGSIALQIRPRLGSSGKDVILDVMNSMAEHEHFHTTARIPLGAEVVIGGITASLGGKDQPRQLYLVMRVDAS
jgi:hypothetical protein